MKKIKLLASLVVASTLFLASVTYAADETQQDVNGVILSGYDTVAYFTMSKPIKGDSSISAVHDGAIYHFSSEANRDTFKADPAKYAPQYGGFCAYGAAIGAKFPIDPEVFAVVDGKLYVNNSADVSGLWNAKQSQAITLADAKWSTIKATPASDLTPDNDLK